MEAGLFKSIVAELVSPALSTLGYEIDFSPPGYDDEGAIWFEKKLQEGIYLVIDFQPRNIELNDFTDFAVNLYRNDPRYQVYKNKQILPGYLLFDRLASWMWIEDRHHPEWQSDYWWHFLNEEELKGACSDVLNKLLKYGVPYLEDLNSISPKMRG